MSLWHSLFCFQQSGPGLTTTDCILASQQPIPMDSSLRAVLLTFCIGLLGVGLHPAGAQPERPVEPVFPDEQQTPKVPDSTEADSGWSYDATARLNVSQAAYKDWQEGGGLNSLTISAATGGVAQERRGEWLQTHELRLAFGVLNQENQALRKSEDQIRYQSSVRYQGDGFFRVFNPTVATQLRTQFASGFNYSENPFEGEVEPGDPRLDQETPVETSSFFAPAFLTESIGLTYQPAEVLTLRLGTASKQTIVVEDDFRELYGVDSEALARVEAGAEFASSLDAQLSENIRYRSDLNAFFAVNQLEEPPDVLWENELILSVNDWLTTNLEFTALYDQTTIDAIQLRETISVGISFTLL
jgi:hypothetical protein